MKQTESEVYDQKKSDIHIGTSFLCKTIPKLAPKPTAALKTFQILRSRGHTHPNVGGPVHDSEWGGSRFIATLISDRWTPYDTTDTKINT